MLSIYQEYKKGSDEYHALENKYIVAWLRVGAIDISYPVTQGKDNDYYLHNTFENQPNIAGCIFMDHGCKKDFSDPNTIIYGHNMRNLSMFGKLYAGEDL